ncbi:MAG: bifunctional 2-C-methyl-D-erythritol 4-phosphate cytidylyltransferase/2-C-methyl-D-erythritol 2,4-cyclodiphosphate synthase [Alphaproteobacteria bacterium]|nr:bifunctional 2-C-methyl-D-erythritol 4-phosphate cytidylyltransferase/2-C-methyl-D-erythritol 2,4-cyclodiphosphate synthase [Alphaproteobacteria bacterium]
MERPSRKTFAVLIVAGGAGTRLGGPVPKQYQDLCGKPVLRWTVERFMNLSCAPEIRIVIHPDHQDLYYRSLSGLHLPPWIPGGPTRQNSVYNGLKALSLAANDIVLVHDAARPFIDEESIDALLRALKTSRAASLASPLVETAVHASAGNIDPSRPIVRSEAFTLQTPQAFRYGDLLYAHETADTAEATDDTSLMRAIGIETALVTGSRRNIKITTTEDMELARTMHSPKTEFRTGTGFDVHAFLESEAKCIRLCGVDIPHDRRLAGHSDADVGLHALTDALLGALGADDIGVHFPPSDPQWKGTDSALFLGHAAKLLLAAGGRLVNADVTIICESPKLGGYRAIMKSRISEILGVPPSRINVKATTTEGLGFAGRGEGIAAQASVSIELSTA